MKAAALVARAIRCGLSMPEIQSLWEMDESMMKAVLKEEEPLNPVYARYLNLVISERKGNSLLTIMRRESSTPSSRLLTKDELYCAVELLSKQNHLTPCVVLFLDMDGLKQINDTKGHMAGDQEIEKAKSLMFGLSRQTDLLSRFGGDEFIQLILPEPAANLKSLARTLEKRWEAALSQPGSPRLSFGVSFGGLYSESVAADLSNLIEVADRQMYASRKIRHSTSGVYS